MAEQNDLPADVASGFRRILELSEDESIPSELAALYERIKRGCDICGAGKPSPRELVMMVHLGGFVSESVDMSPAKDAVDDENGERDGSSDLRDEGVLGQDDSKV